MVLGLVPCQIVLRSSLWCRKGVGLPDVALPAGGLNIIGPVSWACWPVRQRHDVVNRGAAGVRCLAAIDLRPLREQFAMAYLARPVVAKEYRLRRKRFVVASVLDAPNLVAADVDADMERV